MSMCAQSAAQVQSLQMTLTSRNDWKAVPAALPPKFVDFRGHGQISSVLAPLALLLHLCPHPTDPAR